MDLINEKLNRWIKTERMKIADATSDMAAKLRGDDPEAEQKKRREATEKEIDKLHALAQLEDEKAVQLKADVDRLRGGSHER